MTTQEKREKCVKAHQYIYYVLHKQVVTDQEFDSMCKRFGIEGGGGSDRHEDYPAGVVSLAKIYLETI